MGTLVQEADIDQFIRGHKTKLQHERSHLNQYTDQSRYQGGQQVTSPSSRKQWDRSKAQGNRPAEERRAPAEPEETGLRFNYGEQEKKKQQLQSERQQEYNDFVAQKGQRLRRRPRTPSNEGLPLGQYESQRKAFDAERQEEMKKALESKRAEKPPKATVFDYHEAEKAHMAEKRKEYNEFLDKKKQQLKRHIVTPEMGMFIGADQSQRDKENRERNRKNRQALEEQQREQLLFKARQHGQLPKHTPRHVPVSSNQQQPAVLYKPPPPPTPPPAAGQRSEQGQGYVIEERIMDMPKISPRRNRSVSPEPKVAFMSEQEHSPRGIPLYLEGRNEGQGKSHERPRGQGQPDYYRDERRGRGYDKQRDARDKRYDRSLSPDRGHGHPDFERGRRRDREKYHPVEVRRSRTLSPPAERHRHRSPEEILEDQRRMIEELKQTPPTRQNATLDTGVGQTQGQPSLSPGELFRLAQQQKVQRMYEEQMAQQQRILQDEYQREAAEQKRLATEREGLPIGATNRQKLGEERNKEYNEYLAKNAPQRSFRTKEPTPEHLRLGLPLDQGKYDEEKRQRESERQREYNELIQKQQQQQNYQQQEYYPQQQQQQQQYREPAGEYPTQYQAAQSQPYEPYEKRPRGETRRADVLEGTGATLPVGEYDENKRQQLNSERAREYNERQQQKLATERRRGLPPKPPTPNHFFKNIGQHDRQQQMLNEERKKEYNQKLTEERGRTAGRGNYGAEQAATGLQFKNADSAEVRLGKDVYATLPGLHYTESAEARKTRARNDEYNEFLREKQWKDAHRFDNKKPPTAASRRHSEPSSPRGGKKEFATLPGLHYTDSAEKRKMQERNKEYNEFLRQKQTGAKKGWATPTYDEILEQKRREEAYRRQDDDYEPPGMRRYGSEGAINRLENDFRERELDKEFEARTKGDNSKQRPHSDTDFIERRQKLLELTKDFESLASKDFESLSKNAEQVGRSDLQEEMAARVRQHPAFLASLPVGGAPGLGAGQDERDSAKRRRQGDYRRELQLQMEEAKAAKKREKVQELRVNASGLLDPEKSSNRMKGLEGQPGISPRREYRSKEVQPYHTKFLLDDSEEHDALGRRPGDYVRTAPANANAGRLQGLGLGDFGGLGLGSEDHNVLGQPRTAPPRKGILSNGDLGGFESGDDLRLDLGGGGGGRGRRRERDPGLLDPGFAGLLDSRRPVGTANPPPGLVYQPSTYVTGGGGVGGLYNSSIDEAYMALGQRNPLDFDNGGGAVPSLNLGGDYGGGGGHMRGSPTPRVTFADGPPSTRRKQITPAYQFANDDEVRSRSRTETQNYGAELARQIEEKRIQKMREKAEQERYEQKLDQEIANYNPFGRGGGGAPIRDGRGQAIADLRSLRDGPGSYHSPRRDLSPTYSPRPPSPRDDKIRTPPPQQTAEGESTYARGGHGIFGQPKTEAEKDESEKYKDDLRKQIEDKKRREQKEKEQERMEEEKENRRLEEQRQRMNREYDEEQKKIRAREEETRRKNEELKKQADDTKKEAERKRREADDARMRDQQEQLDREKREREQREAAANERLLSPPVPALKVKTNDERGKSPPVPAARRGRDSAASNRSQTSQRVQQRSPAPGPSSDRPRSSDVLTQLASMRKQLQSERRRVENALENSKNEPDVFDPRTVQRPPPNKLIFENAVNKNASLIQPRAQTNDLADARNIQQFNEHKFKAGSDSRKAFRSMFPDEPVTNTTLEAQQDAMLRQQEEQLRDLRDRNPYDPTPSNLSYGRGRGNISARSQLASNSAFIDVEGLHHFPEDFEDMTGARNDTARQRRRERFSPRPFTNNEMGSQASLDVDRIQRKNEERLRRLNHMTTGDDASIGDPDDILDRFMAKQRYNRPPSGQSRQTLQDDTWLNPGNKVV